jgi:hypothetical protein
VSTLRIGIGQSSRIVVGGTTVVGGIVSGLVVGGTLDVVCGTVEPGCVVVDGKLELVEVLGELVEVLELVEV